MIAVFVAIKSKKLNEDFCTSIEKSGYAIVEDYFYTLKECREKLSVSRPHILLLGLDLPDGYWVDFCKETQEKYPDLKILAVTTYNEYTIFKNALDSYTAGYISKDAMPHVIVSAIQAVMEGNYFRYDKIVVSIEKEEPYPEWLQTLLKQMIDPLKKDANPLDWMEKTSQIIRAIEKERRTEMKNLMADENADINHHLRDKFLMQLVENLFIQGRPNWEIADTLNISIETVRLYRMEFILKLSGKNSMQFNIKKDGEAVKLARREIQILQLIAAGFTSQEIADKVLYVDTETVKTTRKILIQKFEAKNAMSMVISAMRKGLLKIEDIDNVLNS